MDITIRCPNCLQEVPRDDSFCIYCGCDLGPSVISAVSREEREETRRKEIRAKADGSGSELRTCKNGHNVDDPELDYCPECGLPLGKHIIENKSHWVCACGARNGESLSVCRACRKPRGWEPDPVPSEVILSGMRLPRPEDLRKKK